MAPRMFITFVYCYTKNVQPAPLSTQPTHSHARPLLQKHHILIKLLFDYHVFLSFYYLLVGN